LYDHLVKRKINTKQNKTKQNKTKQKLIKMSPLPDNQYWPEQKPEWHNTSFTEQNYIEKI
jgi:hypothetical protein